MIYEGKYIAFLFNPKMCKNWEFKVWRDIYQGRVYFVVNCKFGQLYLLNIFREIAKYFTITLPGKYIFWKMMRREKMWEKYTDKIIKKTLKEDKNEPKKD